MTVVVGACFSDVAVIATDTRLSRETPGGREVVRDDETKLRYSGKGWYAGAGLAMAIDWALEGLRDAVIEHTDDVHRTVLTVRQAVLERVKHEHPDRAAQLDGTSIMLTVRVAEGPVLMVVAPRLVGDLPQAVRPGKTLVIPPFDVPPEVADSIASGAGAIAPEGPTQEMRIMQLATFAARTARGIVGVSKDVSDRLDIGIHRAPESAGDAALIRLHGRTDDLAACATVEELMRFDIARTKSPP